LATKEERSREAGARKVSRFEAADRGTLFLDEIGDIPLELQAKLLRVLQEGEFERLDSTQTLRADVRLVAATNHDLTDMVSKKHFRSDLYYRLNVFPIAVPPLRDRLEDIPLLVEHFVKIFAKQMGKQIDEIPTKVSEDLVSHSWPGNIRELQNFIERAVTLSRGHVLQVSSRDVRSLISAGPNFDRCQTMEDAERKHLLATLKQTKWLLQAREGQRRVWE
jgi:formate hydrogenlyase transcriptional activator